MKIIFFWFFFLISFFSAFTQSYASIEDAYNDFIQKIEMNYGKENKIIILQFLDTKIHELDSIIPEEKKDNFSILENINQEEIFQTKVKNQVSLDFQKEYEKLYPEAALNNKIPYSKLSKDIRWVLTDDWKISLDNGNQYVAIVFENYRFFTDLYGVYYSSLIENSIELGKSYFYVNNQIHEGYTRWEKYIHIVSEYQEYPLFSVNSYFWLHNKYEVLQALSKDMAYPRINVETTLNQIKNTTLQITQGKTEAEKIEAIYAWILQNISYTENIDHSKKEIFSWLETYLNKQWVCTGYARLFLYMLSFAGINDAEVIEGYVIDAQDFPEIWHAWVRVGDRYYDPTFDDPIGRDIPKVKSEYLYFSLPKDIFYTNRYEISELPEFIKNLSIEERFAIVYKNLEKLFPKYENQLDNFPVFWGVAFRKKYNIPLEVIITPEILAEKIWFYTVKNNSFKFGNNTIKELHYYIITQNNTPIVLKQLSYDIDHLMLFYWQTASWNWEWRLAYDIKLE